MARLIGPTNKLARRERVDLGLKTSGTAAHRELLKRLNIIPGQHGQKRVGRKMSSYGLQLREKQKVKRIYGVLEKQFRKYFKIARKELGNTGEALLSLLERRLDNVIYRLGLAPTRAFARQIVTHGHVKVDNRKVDIPSFLVEPGMVIAISDKILNTPLLKTHLSEKQPNIAGWLKRKGPIGKVLREPKREDILEDIAEQLIIEFYSR